MGKVAKCNISKSKNIPVEITNSEGLEGKARAFAHALFVPLGGGGGAMTQLDSVARRFNGICTDRGAEIGFSVTQGGHMTSYIPPWLRPIVLAQKTLMRNAGSIRTALTMQGTCCLNV